MKLFNTTSLTGSVLAILACAAMGSCSRSADRVGGRQDVSTTTTTASEINAASVATAPAITQDTASNTTIAAADDTAAPAPLEQGANDTAAPADKPAKKAKHHKAKKRSHKKAASDASNSALPSDPVVMNEDDSFLIDPSQGIGAVDASRDFDDTVSGTTMAPIDHETGLSPFVQEPFSRVPGRIGSGQLTGEDKSTTILEGPNMFQDPAAYGRDLIQ